MINGSFVLQVSTAFVFSTGVASSIEAREALDCSSASMDLLRKAAQGYDSEALIMAEDLLKCPKLSDEALLWRTIYLSFSGGAAEAAGLSHSSSASPLLSGWRGEVFSSAAKGSYSELQSLVESKKASWHDDAESNLVLARALLRDSQLSGARASYERYFQLKPDDYDIRIEAAFSLLHDDWIYARNLFDYLATRELKPSQKEAIERGYKLIEVTRRGQSSSLASANSREVPLGIEQFWSSYFNFYRRSLQSGYRAPALSLDAALINLTSEVPDSSQTAVELSAQKRFTVLTRSTTLLGKLGWFQGAVGTPVGQLLLSHSLESGLSLAIGHQTEPWAKFFPLSRDYTRWLNNVELIGFNFKNFLEYRFTYNTITDQGAGRRHTAVAYLPLANFRANQDQLKLKLLGENYSTERYSAFYHSPKDANIFLPGLFLESAVREWLRVVLEVDYGTVSETPHPDAFTARAPTASGKIYQGVFEMRAGMSERWSLFAGARYTRNSNDSGGTVYEESLVNLAAVWNFETSTATRESKP